MKLSIKQTAIVAPSLDIEAFTQASGANDNKRITDENGKKKYIRELDIISLRITTNASELKLNENLLDEISFVKNKEDEADYRVI